MRIYSRKFFLSSIILKIFITIGIKIKIIKVNHENIMNK